MQFEADAEVLTANNEKVGKLERVVIDPRNKEVTHLVVRKGLLFKHDKVLPVETVATTDEGQVRLRPDAGDLTELPDFEETHYVMADNGVEVPPSRETEELEANTTAAAPMTGASVAPAVGAGVVAPSLLWYPPAVGYNSYPPGPLAAAPRTVKTVDRNIPDNSVPLKEGAKVVDADGKTVGRIERVFVNSESRQATHLLLEHGMVSKTHKTIPVHWVGDVTEREVQLVVSEKLLEGLPEYKN